MSLLIPIFCGIQSYDSNLSDQFTNSSGLTCPNCHNQSVHLIKKRQFFTIWFVPVLPIYWGKQIKCDICSWDQDVNHAKMDEWGMDKMKQ